MTALPGLSYLRRRRLRGRWAAFSDVELTELLIALDHRQLEARPGYMGGPGNAYVRTDVVDALISDLERHCVTGR